MSKKGVNRKVVSYEIGNSFSALEEGDLFECFFVLGKSNYSTEGYESTESEKAPFYHNVLAQYPQKINVPVEIIQTMRAVAFPEGIRHEVYAVSPPKSEEEWDEIEMKMQVHTFEQASEVEKRWFPYYFQGGSCVYYGLFFHVMENYHEIPSWESEKRETFGMGSQFSEYEKFPVAVTQRCYCLVSKRPYFKSHLKFLIDVVAREKLAFQRNMKVIAKSNSPRRATLDLIESYHRHFSHRKEILISKQKMLLEEKKEEAEGNKDLSSSLLKKRSPRLGGSMISPRSPVDSNLNNKNVFPDNLTFVPVKSKSFADLVGNRSNNSNSGSSGFSSSSPTTSIPLTSAPKRANTTNNVVEKLNLSKLDINNFNEAAVGDNSSEAVNKIRGASFELWQTPRSGSFEISANARRKEHHILETCLVPFFNAYGVKWACKALCVALMGYSVVLEHPDLYIRGQCVAALAAMMKPHHCSTSVCTVTPNESNSQLRMVCIEGEIGQQMFSIGTLNEEDMNDLMRTNKVVFSVRKKTTSNNNNNNNTSSSKTQRRNPHRHHSSKIESTEESKLKKAMKVSKRKRKTIYQSVVVKCPQELLKVPKNNEEIINNNNETERRDSWQCPFLKVLIKELEFLYDKHMGQEGVKTINYNACEDVLKALERFHRKIVLKLVLPVAVPGIWRRSKKEEEERRCFSRSASMSSGLSVSSSTSYSFSASSTSESLSSMTSEEEEEESRFVVNQLYEEDDTGTEDEYYVGECISKAKNIILKEMFKKLSKTQDGKPHNLSGLKERNYFFVKKFSETYSFESLIPVVSLAVESYLLDKECAIRNVISPRSNPNLLASKFADSVHNLGEKIDARFKHLSHEVEKTKRRILRLSKRSKKKANGDSNNLRTNRSCSVSELSVPFAVESSEFRSVSLATDYNSYTVEAAAGKWYQKVLEEKLDESVQEIASYIDPLLFPV